MSDLLLLQGGVKRDAAVGIWLIRHADELGVMAHAWFTHMRARGDDVCELLHDGCPVVCVGAAPFCYVNAFKTHVNVGFFRGATLPDPARLLEGNGKRMRHVKLKPGVEFNKTALRELINAAYADIKLQLENRR